MNELLKKIYESVIYYEKDTVKMGSHVDVEIHKLIEQYADQLPSSDMEKIKSLLFQTALTAEQEGFQLGLKYALKILVDLLSD